MGRTWWQGRPVWCRVDQPRPSRIPWKLPPREGVIETQPGGGLVQTGQLRSRVLPDSELARLGIVKGGDGRYYKAQDGPGGAIVLLPVDSCV